MYAHLSAKLQKPRGRAGPNADTLLDLWVASAMRPNELPFTPDDLARIACPTLILHGDRDLFFPVRVPVTMYEAIPDAELGIAPGYGHDPGFLPLFGPAILGFLGRYPIGM
jgi:pimeloyl-ACP methyl ester carboxylesterase